MTNHLAKADDSSKESLLEHIKLRPGDASDAPLIFSSWLKSYRKSEWSKAFSNEIYFEGHRKLIEQILHRAHVTMLVSRDDDSHIYGWVCFEPSQPIPVLHYVYVKQAYRELGLARVLLGEMMNLPVMFSHETSFTGKLAKGSRYNPYKALGGA